MATITNATFPRILKTLRENNVKEKREILTYVSSQAKKIEASGIIKEERYKDLCKLVIEAFTKHEGSVQNEALAALNAILREFKAHPLHLFESMLQTDERTRLKVLKLLEMLEDNPVAAAANDGQTLNFFKNCMQNVQSNIMEWLTPTACMDNLQMLTKVEHQPMSDEQKLEEDTNNYSLALLRRLYRLAAITFDQNVQRFDTLLMDKIITLAYMGHKRQRGPALKVLQQAIATNSSSRIRKEYPDLWAQYKTNLQSTYCKRMLLLVAACDPDWTTQWNITIQFLGTDLHRGANLINNLLSVEEKAFKSTDPIIRRQAFLSWKLLIDNFALDNQELATTRRIKLLCIPLNAKNSKTELIALTKLEVWWHLIIKLYKDIAKFTTPVITQFLNYCFGPLGDTPLLSSKFDVVASPGKRFFKTKVVAVDALCQLVVTKEDFFAVCAPMLEERLPNAISNDVFQECSKSIIHSIGEALLILGQLTDQEMKNRFQLGKTLWASLMIYIRGTKLETKDHLYRNVILVVTELGSHIDKLMVKDMIFNVILPDINNIIEKTEFHDNALPELVLKLLSSPVLNEVAKYILDYNSDAIKCLLERCISPEFTYSSGVLGFLETIMENLKSVSKTHETMIVYMELWSIIADTLTKYITNSEANENEYNLKTIKSVLSFPFQHICLENLEQMQNPTRVWKALYKQLELQSDSSTIKPNEILLDTASMMRNCLNTNKNCCSFIVNCLDDLLINLDYESLLSQNEIPSIMQLILDIITMSFNNVQNHNSEVALKTLSAMLITVYGHSSQKIVLYLHSCKLVIELILASPTKTLFKEIASTWEYIISIFKGLKKQLNHELLSSYKEAIVIAMNHPNPDIKNSTQSIFEIKNSLDSNAKCILDEIEKTVEKSQSKSDSTAKKKTEIGQAKEVHIVGSFLNRKSTNTKSTSNKQLEKNDKNMLLLPEPDSQDYVYIKTDLKFDVNRLTEHQKETLKKKREDIPALYNDLSQSSSQNSQNLQQWFDIKTKYINEDKVINKKSDLITQKPVDNDANKENKIVTAQTSNIADKVVGIYNELDENIEENIDTNQSEDSVKKIENENSKRKQNENIDISKQASFSGQDIMPEVDEEADSEDGIVSAAKKLNFESHEEFPADKTLEQQSSPSMLDSVKRRHRNSMMKMSSLLTSDETIESQKDPSISSVQKSSRVKIIQEKCSTIDKQKPDDDVDIKENSNENKKGIKRKYVSDTESDSIAQRRKRKLIGSTKNSNDDSGETSRGETSRCDKVSSDIDMDSVSQRVKNEMSRLKINMVFDCPVVNRRRIKHPDEEKDIFVHGLRKYGTSDSKSFKLKSTDVKLTEGFKKSPKTERNTKDAKDTDDTDQGALKRRGRRSTKQEPNKSDLDINKDIKKFNDITDKVPESKNSTDTDITQVATSSSAIQDIHEAQDEKLDKDNSKSNSDVESSVLTEPNEQSQDEVEDVVENSQSSNVDIKDKIHGDKSCFIKINKIGKISDIVKIFETVKTSDVIVEKNYVPESIPMDHGDTDVPDPCKQSDETNTNNIAEINDERNKANVNKDSVQEIDISKPKTTISENQKTIDNSSTIKSTSITNFSSPKSTSKVFSKPKPFTGRAAHMLGLVTKQTRIESDNSTIIFEDESSVKKLKCTKDASENETSANKKILTVKEIDKVGGPSGSRQEKIFSNMRSADYCASPSTHMFTTLRNDGEKASYKVDKSMSDCLSMETSVDKENEGGTSSTLEKDDLPILEWSSANPPSLTASPSASILKRQRSSIPESDTDSSTPNKRKRVSFADPPVSKEMGYEISNTESPQKTNKYPMTRSPTPKKDSPVRFKQTKLKPTDTENTQSESSAEDVLEKQNESLKRLSEAYLEIMDIDEQISGNSVENDNIMKANSRVIIKIDEELALAQEIEITAESVNFDVSEDQQLLSSEDSVDNRAIDCVRTDDSETQQDIFDGTDIRNNTSPVQTDNDDINVSIQNNSIDSVKLNVTNDSVIGALSTKDDNSINMEDTIDIQNIIELNSTVNTEDVFCGKLIRSSTHATENVAEQDTLPVTDSIFASLPLTQDSQNQEAPNNTDPEFLDSTQAIYPNLSLCMEPVDTIIEQLTYPLWKQNLRTYFTTRTLCTIGDLAQLSEREVNRMPVKGVPKTEFVKKILERFESTCASQAQAPDKMTNGKTIQLADVTLDGKSSVPIAANVEEASTTTDDNKTPLDRPTENIPDNQPREKSPIEHLDKTQSISSDISLEHGYSEIPNFQNINAPVLDSSENGETNGKVPIAAQSLPETSTDKAEFAISSSFSADITTTSETAPSTSVSVEASESSVESSNIYDELLITHSSIGTSTDEINFLTPTVQKVTRSVESQMALEELLDEIDVNLVLESAVRRCSPEAILLQYKVKMGHLKETELVKETIRMLGLQNKQQVNDASLKAACRACGVNKVLLRLPDIFGHDKQFFDKVLNVYSKKLNIVDCLNVFDFNQLKNVIRQKYTSSELVEMLSEKLKQEEQEGIKQPMPESSLAAMLQRLPMDVIISHTVANEELIPAPLVLDIALQNNSSGDIVQALKQSPVMAKRVLDKLWTSQFMVTHIENTHVSKESLLNIFKSVCSKLTTQELLDAYHETMSSKLATKNENKSE